MFFRRGAKSVADINRGTKTLTFPQIHSRCHYSFCQLRRGPWPDWSPGSAQVGGPKAAPFEPLDFLQVGGPFREVGGRGLPWLYGNSSTGCSGYKDHKTKSKNTIFKRLRARNKNTKYASNYVVTAHSIPTYRTQYGMM